MPMPGAPGDIVRLPLCCGRWPSSAQWEPVLGSASTVGEGGDTMPPAESWGPGSPGSQLCASGTNCAPGAAQTIGTQTVGFCRFSSELKDACHSPALCFLSCANYPGASGSPFFSPTPLLPLLCPPNLQLFWLLLSKSQSDAINICRTFPMKVLLLLNHLLLPYSCKLTSAAFHVRFQKQKQLARGFTAMRGRAGM